MRMDGGKCETLEFVLETFFDNHVLIIALLCATICCQGNQRNGIGVPTLTVPMKTGKGEEE